jgi:UDP-glucose 4-epimerase
MKKISGKTVLVTGGAGFVGSVFSERLIKMDCNVIVYDNLSSGRYELIEHLAKSKRFSFVKGDMLDLKRLTAQFRKHRPDVVVHLAANPDIMKSLKDTRLDLEQGTIATYNLVEACRRLDVDDILFSSSSAAYGESRIKPTPEDYGPMAPISLYGASKLASEGLVTSFSHLYDMDYYIYRFANVTGRNLTHTVVHSFISKLNEDSRNLHVFSDGTPVKGYLDVDDCVEAMLLVHRKSAERENVYNIALKDQISVREIAEMVVKRFSPRAKISYGKHHYGWPGDIVNTYLSNKKIMKIGFRPKYKTSREVIRHSIEANSKLYNPK